MKQSILQKFLAQRQYMFTVAFISTYIPRKCGIATFTKDLSKNMNPLNPNHLARIVAMNDSEKEPIASYPWEVATTIEKNVVEEYVKAAQFLNRSSTDIISLQHEYGIFGGKSGVYILALLEHVKKPVVTTFHTVLEKPSPEQKEILQKIAKYSAACVVMAEEGAKRLEKIYHIPTKKIVIIPHGVPNMGYTDPNLHKETLGFTKDDFLLGSINLVSSNKGYEYILEALPQIKKVIPHIKFLMIGQTHPIVKVLYGEVYRKKLEALAKELGVEEQLIEVNRYISLEKLMLYLQALDVYITPYLDMSQTTSGGLAYAIGAGKLCIATPYIYAKEVLGKNRGILIPSKDANALAKAVIQVYDDTKLRERLQKNAYAYGRTMIWSRVAFNYLNLFQHLLGRK